MKNNNQYSTGLFDLSATKKQTTIFLQIIIFSQSLLCATVLWLMTESFEGAIYGFMLGTLSTIVAVFFQCHKSGCLNHNLTVFGACLQCGKVFFFFAKPIMAILFFLLYSTSIAY